MRAAGDDYLDYLLEYLRAQLESDVEEGLKIWNEQFIQFLERRQYNLCRRLLKGIKGFDLPAFGRGIVRYNEGSLYDLHGYWQEAITAYKASLQAFKSSEIPIFNIEQWTGAVLGRLATIEEARGNYAEVRHLYKQQLQIYGRKASNQRPVDSVLGELVRLAILQGDYIEAEQFLRRRLTIANEGNTRGQVDILLELAALYQRIGDLKQADSCCQQALEIAQSVGYRVAVVDALRQQASVNRSRWKLEDARKLYQAALDAALEMGDQFRAGQIREQLTALETTPGKNIFISYSHHDRGFVKRLAHNLKAVGLTVWWDEWEIKVGDSIIQKISEGINQSAYLAVVLSPHSVQSNWVQRELGSALMRQLSANRDITVLPLLISACEIPELLLEIKRADFRQDYQAGFEQLLDALIAKGASV